MSKTPILLFFYALFFYLSLHGELINIVIKNKNNHIQEFAAMELKKYLKIVFPEYSIKISKDSKINALYTFKIGYVYGKLNDEVNYVIKNNEVYLFGQDKINRIQIKPFFTVTDFNNKVGTLFSIYDFLYHELGFRWTSPFEDDIVFLSKKKLKLRDKTYSWNSKYKFRRIRNDIWKWNRILEIQKTLVDYIPKTLYMNKQYVKKMMYNDLLWKRKLKQETSDKPNYGHSFIKYWNKYGESHPEWFALSSNNKRGKKGFKNLRNDQQKFCVSNRKLQDEIIENWKKTNYKYNIYNASVNDGRGYCTCDDCKKLDSIDLKHDDFQKKSKSDRYVYFWNSLYKKILKINPSANIIAYAYSDYRYPPKNIRLNENIILGFVPRFKDSKFKVLFNINEWKKKGLKKIFYRPNDLNDDIGLPMGHEKYIWNRLNILKQYDILGLDYDSAFNIYNLSYDGITKYILMQSFNYSSKSFEELENEYYSTFGKASEEIKEFYLYWRNNFVKRRLEYIDKFGGFSGRKNIYDEIEKFFNTQDFVITQQILENASVKVKDNPRLLNKINRLKIVNNHSFLLFNAIKSKFDIIAHNKLKEYRIQYKNTLNLNWARLYELEYKYSNIKYFQKKLNKFFNRF